MRYMRFPIFTALAVLSVAACSRNRPSDDTSMGQPTDTRPDTASARPEETAVRPDTTTSRPDTTTNTADTSRTNTDSTSANQTDSTSANANGAAAGDTAGQIAMGDSIFMSKVGGKNCQSCHGRDAKGTTMAPDLTDNKWLHGDGSLEFIKQIVRNGVQQPKKHSSGMPAFKNTFSEEQINAIAAYVRSKSQKPAS